MSESSAVSSGFTINGAPIVNCGVYSWDVLNTYLTPYVCSVRNTQKTAQHDTVDYFIIYPGYKIVVYNNIDYITQDSVMDNTYGNKIMIRKCITINQADSMKIYYNNTEIILNGISNDTAPPLMTQNEVITT